MVYLDLSAVACLVRNPGDRAIFTTRPNLRTGVFGLYQISLFGDTL